MSYHSFYKGKRIPVTGGAGFLGSFLCERLLAQGAEVLCVDNYFTGRRANIAHLFANPMFEALRRVGLEEGLEKTIAYFRQFASG